MADLRSVLDEATQAELISRETSERLLPFLMDRGVIVREGFEAAQSQRPHTLAEELSSVEPDTETPRFVRGFHDILITVGVVILLTGLAAVSSLYVILPVILLLSEVLVRRQRLALPAVALTFALVGWTAAFVVSAGWATPSWEAPTYILSAFPIALGLYYLRYRIPISFAICVVSGFAFLLSSIVYLMRRATGDVHFPADSPIIVSVVFLVSALSLFAIALFFDLSDTKRVTTRSDIAFWLHMATAPALLYSSIFTTIALISGGDATFVLTQRLPTWTATVAVTVAVLMLIGLIIDRRAFVTAGMASLAAAIYGAIRHDTANGTIDVYFGTTLLIVGVIILVIGIGWVPLRRLALGLFPYTLSNRLPRAL